MIRVNRADFLRHLESVSCGLSSRDIVEQSSAFVFRKGEVLTYNDELACRVKSMLPKTIEGAVTGAPLLSILSKYAEEYVEIRVTKSRFYVQGKRDESWAAMEAEVTMPFDEHVDKPASFQKIKPEFIEAIALVKDSASKDEESFAITCVHLHPNWIEAGDNDQVCRFKLDTGLKKPVYIKRDTIKHIIPLDMTEIAVGETWVHFRNPSGLVVACRRWHEQYPDWSPYFKVKGAKTTLPKGIIEACEMASKFSQENESDLVKISISKGRLLLEAEGVSGGHRSRRKVKYDGKKLTFMIGPTLLSEVVKKSPDCIMNDRAVLVNGGKWQFVASLEMPNGKDGKDNDGGRGSEEAD